MNYNQAFMATHTLEALLLILAAAVMNATYTLPMKLNRRWAWEHSWLAFTLLGVIAVPTALAVATVPRLFSIYPQIPPATLAAMAFFGAGWGVSLVLFGLAIEMVGVAVTFAVCLGTSAASGALIPLLAQHLEKVATREGALILGGIATILVGVALCGVASSLRDRGAAASAGRSHPVRGAVYAFVSGVLGSLFPLGLSFGGAILRAAEEHGASELMKSNAVWLPCLYAGFLPGVIYCLFLMRKHGNTAELAGNSRWYYWVMAALMGVLWYGSIVLYAISTTRLGELGTSIGWPLFLSSIVVASTIVGVVAGEWAGAGKRALRFMVTGVLFLVGAIVVLSQANR
jgi:L-rhamnose-H+ transport protein